VLRYSILHLRIDLQDTGVDGRSWRNVREEAYRRQTEPEHGAINAIVSMRQRPAD
jgi:hypothetical protein